MKTIFRNKVAVILLSALVLLPAVMQAQVPGTIYKTDGGKASGNIRYLPSSKAYEVTVPPSTQMRIQENQVLRLDITKPAEFDAAYKQVKAKQYAAAAPALERLIANYKNLQWDMLCLPLLAECYFKTAQDAKAIDMLKQVLNAPSSGGGQGITAELFGMYLDALIRQKRLDEAERAITQVIESGSREAAAAAQIKRGDVLKEKGKVKEALVDGYLRTVFLFSEVKEVRPEALYKAAQAFQDLSQQSHADKMRKILLGEFPNDPYSAKLKGGT